MSRKITPGMTRRSFVTSVGSVIAVGSLLLSLSLSLSSHAWASHVNKFIVDGEKQYTKGDKIEEKVLYFVASEKEQEGIVYGFTSEAKMEEWMKANGYEKLYERIQRQRKRAQLPRSPEEEAKIKGIQMKLINDGTARFENTVKKLGYFGKKDEVEKFIQNPDPLVGGNTGYIYKDNNCSQEDTYKRIPNGTALNHLSWYNLNNNVSSAQTNGFLELCDQENLVAPCKEILPGACRAHLEQWPYFFGDKASSAQEG